MAEDPLDRYWKLEQDLATRQHDVEREGAAAHFKQAEAFGLMTVRSIGFAAAGGIAAVLGFYSANYARLAANPASLERLNVILAWLFVALLLGLVASGMGYWSQSFYAESKWRLDFSIERPFVRTNAKSDFSRRIGTICRWCSIGATFAGIIVLIVVGLNFLGVVR